MSLTSDKTPDRQVNNTARNYKLMIVLCFRTKSLKVKPRITSVQYCGGIASVLRGVASVLWRDSISISTAEAVQCPAVLKSLRSTEPTLYGMVRENMVLSKAFARCKHQQRCLPMTSSKNFKEIKNG